MEWPKDLPWFRLQQWYFYGVATFFSYGRFLKAKLARSVASHATAGSGVASLGLGNVGMFLLAHHSMMSYLGWMCGFVLFVLSLRKRRYVYQFGQFAWTHMIVATVLMQSSCFVANVLEGLIWLYFPSSSSSSTTSRRTCAVFSSAARRSLKSRRRKPGRVSSARSCSRSSPRHSSRARCRRRRGLRARRRTT